MNALVVQALACLEEGPRDGQAKACTTNSNTLPSAVEAAGGLAVQCSYCRRWKDSHGSWIERTDALSSNLLTEDGDGTGIFTEGNEGNKGGRKDAASSFSSLPSVNPIRVSHGICPQCDDAVRVRYGLPPREERAA